MRRMIVEEREGEKWVSISKLDSGNTKAVSLSYSWKPGDASVSVSRDFHNKNFFQFTTRINNCIHLRGDGYCDGSSIGWFRVLPNGMPTQQLLKILEEITFR